MYAQNLSSPSLSPITEMRTAFVSALEVGVLGRRRLARVSWVPRSSLSAWCGVGRPARQTWRCGSLLRGGETLAGGDESGFVRTHVKEGDMGITFCYSPRPQRNAGAGVLFVLSSERERLVSWCFNDTRGYYAGGSVDFVIFYSNVTILKTILTLIFAHNLRDSSFQIWSPLRVLSQLRDIFIPFDITSPTPTRFFINVLTYTLNCGRSRQWQIFLSF